MRTLIFALFIVLVLFNASAYALSDVEYKNFINKYSVLTLANKLLDETLKRIQTNISEDAKDSLRFGQREWIKTGWDTRANELMNNNDLPKSQAYTQAINERIEYFENYNHSISQEKNNSTNLTGNTDKIITVRAEGSGTTKMEALQNAWMEAVRNGVGMFMAAKSEAIDDKLTEQIVVHSRGQVNSYKMISEKHDNGLWNVVIDANINKDILKETVVSSQSKTLAFDASNDAARNISTNVKEKSRKEILASAAEILDITKLLSYNATLGSDTNNGAKKYYITNELKFNLKNFIIQAREFEKILVSAATSRYEVEFDIKSVSKLIKLLQLQTCQSIPPIYKLITGNCGEPSASLQYNSSQIKYNSICIFKNAASMTCYQFDEEDYAPLAKKIYKKYKILFTAETDDELIPILAKKGIYTSFPYLFKPGFSKTFLLILPEFTDQKVSIIQYNLPLELDDEQLLNIKSIKGKYTITPEQ